MRALSMVVIALTLTLRPSVAAAQWSDPRLVAGQVGLHVAASLFGKLVVGRAPLGQAFREALQEGAAAGFVAHAGYSISARHPRLALPGKVLAQKAALMTRRSMHSEPVFDASLYSDWALTHSALHFRFQDRQPSLEIDVANLAFASYFALSRGDHQFDPVRTLYTGSFVFRNDAPPAGVRGLYLPGVIWLDGRRWDDSQLLGHELIHSLQAERGMALRDWRKGGFRLNLLVAVNGLPAVLLGWPEHDRRTHELEANRYAGQ